MVTVRRICGASSCCSKVLWQSVLAKIDPTARTSAIIGTERLMRPPAGTAAARPPLWTLAWKKTNNALASGR